MNIHKFKNSLFLILIIAASSCSVKEPVMSVWRSDSGNESWREQMHYDSDNNLLWMVSNDEENVYLDIKTEDPGLKSKIMGFGMTVWIDTNAKKKKRFGIKFPTGAQGMAQRRQENRNPGEMNQRPDRMQMQKELLSNMIIYDYESGKQGRMVMITPGEGIQPEIKMGKDLLSYHLCIPLSSVFYSQLHSPENLSLSIGIESGYLDITKMQGSRGSMGGGMPGGGRPGGGAMPGGGRPGGSSMSGTRSGGGQNMQAMMSPAKIWIKNIRLTGQKL